MLYNSSMQFHALDIAVNPWQERTYEIIARFIPYGASAAAMQAGHPSARQLARFPLSPSALEARRIAVSQALAHADLRAWRGAGQGERAVEEFALLLYRFLFTGEIRRLLEEARAAAVSDWHGLRLLLRINAPDLRDLPWEVLWDILAFDLTSLKRGLFDLRVDREQVSSLPASRQPPPELHPTSIREGSQASAILRQADEAFYSSDWQKAIELYEAGLRIDPGSRQAREAQERARACLQQRDPRTTVPPRAASSYRRAWELYTQYRLAEAMRWSNEAWLLAKDWGIAEWPEAHDLHARLERCLAGLADYQQALERAGEGDLPGALEAIAQALRADPLDLYRKAWDTWETAFRKKEPQMDADKT